MVLEWSFLRFVDLDICLAFSVSFCVLVKLLSYQA